jgi:hypothetical protein
MNFQNGYNVPIMAVLCDGSYFYFFKFENRQQEDKELPFSLGTFPDGNWRLSIAETDSDDPVYFVRRTRLLCESLYYTFLSGYRSGLEAYWNRSMERSKSKGTLRESTPKWQNAKLLAGQALEEAKSAWNLRQDNQLEESKASAESALRYLKKR